MDFKNSFNETTNNQINFEDDPAEIKEKIKSGLHSDFGDGAIDYIFNFWKDNRNSKIEYGQVFNYETGEIVSKKFKGTSSSVTIEFPETNETSLATIHNHPYIGFSVPSGNDFEMAMEQWWNKYVVIISLFEIWVIGASAFYAIEQRRDIALDINRGLNGIKEDIKFQNFSSRELKFAEANKRAGKFIKEYILKNSQYDINVYGVLL